MKALALALVLLGCGKDRSDREIDGAKVRNIVDQALTRVPARDRDQVLQDRAREQLTKVDDQDAEVQRAASDPQIEYARIERRCS